MREVQFTYKNHKGEVEIRRIIPDSLDWIDKPGFNYQPGWFLSGHDLDRNARRSFRLSHIELPEDREGFFILRFKEMINPPESV